MRAAVPKTSVGLQKITTTLLAQQRYAASALPKNPTPSNSTNSGRVSSSKSQPSLPQHNIPTSNSTNPAANTVSKSAETTSAPHHSPTEVFPTTRRGFYTVSPFVRDFSTSTLRRAPHMSREAREYLISIGPEHHADISFRVANLLSSKKGRSPRTIDNSHLAASELPRDHNITLPQDTPAWRPIDANDASSNLPPDFRNSLP